MLCVLSSGHKRTIHSDHSQTQVNHKGEVKYVKPQFDCIINFTYLEDLCNLIFFSSCFPFLTAPHSITIPLTKQNYPILCEF